jgi:hypothetical protein
VLLGALLLGVLLLGVLLLGALLLGALLLGALLLGALQRGKARCPNRTVQDTVKDTANDTANDTVNDAPKVRTAFEASLITPIASATRERRKTDKHRKMTLARLSAQKVYFKFKFNMGHR